MHSSPHTPLHHPSNLTSPTLPFPFPLPHLFFVSSTPLVIIDDHIALLSLDAQSAPLAGIPAKSRPDFRRACASFTVLLAAFCVEHDFGLQRSASGGNVCMRQQVHLRDAQVGHVACFCWRNCCWYEQCVPCQRSSLRVTRALEWSFLAWSLIWNMLELDKLRVEGRGRVETRGTDQHFVTVPPSAGA